MSDETQIILDVQQLRTSFATPAGTVVAVSDISFQVRQGETLAIVGESGCGKSVTSFSLMGLLASNAVTTGKARLQIATGEYADLIRGSEAAKQALRGKAVSMIFQEPMTSLNPLQTVADQIAEAITVHGVAGKKAAQEKALQLLKLVGISDPETRAKQYPHQLSGGMRQRVMIAIALACEPRLLIADEPTTALDVTIQAQILQLIRELQQATGMGVIFITHDMGVVAQIADRVAVMYGGHIVESGTVAQIFQAPVHPYTRGLLAAIPRPGPDAVLSGIPGQVESVTGEHRQCRFANRCEHASSLCHQQLPKVTPVAPQHTVACHHWRHTTPQSTGVAI
ncbi:ABC transporter ATP-binding protein [Undibacterium squillarum]|uniref:ABC transporter ATP-binding protein n=1 Tax=Undibacterium squillarum TaxID=1131567 RepID=A0ABQ2XX05_9BURK|nr:ABC transporter ATP-binding protein [Undibacterium squillarum]GGX35594.1 ABC transporter ATP-binding protein [Undibacterium squillarum]